jgi:hypothetical protein
MSTIDPLALCRLEGISTKAKVDCDEKAEMGQSIRSWRGEKQVGE